MGNLGDKREHGGASLCTRENTRERSLHGLIDMKVALPLRFAFFFFKERRNKHILSDYAALTGALRADWVADEGWIALLVGVAEW